MDGIFGSGGPIPEPMGRFGILPGYQCVRVRPSSSLHRNIPGSELVFGGIYDIIIYINLVFIISIV